MQPPGVPLPGGYAIEHAKLVRYLLNVDHPDGRSKARFFRNFGFNDDNVLEFASAFLGHPLVLDHQSRAIETPWGVKFIYEGAIPTPSGKVAHIRTVWIGDREGGDAKLVTAIPAPMPKQVSALGHLPAADRIRGVVLEAKQSVGEGDYVCLEYADLEGYLHQLRMPAIQAFYLANLLVLLAKEIGLAIPDTPLPPPPDRNPQGGGEA